QYRRRMETIAVPLEDVERNLLLWAGRVAAGEAELLRLIGEWDAREGWAAAGSLSCAQWLSWRLGLGANASRERVRVARALRQLPQTTKAMAAGQLSFSQARALTRVASGEDESTWLDLARATTAQQLEKAVRGAQRALQPVRDAEDPAASEQRFLPRMSWDEDGSLVLTLRIRPAHAPMVIASLEQAQAAEQADRDAQIAAVAERLVSGEGVTAVTPEATPEPYTYVEPDYPGLADIGRLLGKQSAAQTAAIAEYWEEKKRRRAKADDWQAYERELLLEAEKQGATTRKATLTDGFLRLLTGGAHTVKVNLLIDPMSGWARTTKDELLPPETVAEMVGSGHRMPRIRPITPADLQRLDRGRDSRLVTPALRTLLGQVDGECCRFPGCTRTKKLDAHHVTYWRDGGRTDLANLLLLCARHHTVAHEQGFQLELQQDRTLVVTTKDGTRLEHLPAQPRQPKGDLPRTQPLASQWNGDRLDLHHVAWVLSQHAA
ncbi:MAG: endonuclease, partial [Frankiales bacterium]|nr:endonuclease [Frankiales bacterium]